MDVTNVADASATFLFYCTVLGTATVHNDCIICLHKEGLIGARSKKAERFFYNSSVKNNIYKTIRFLY